MTGHVGNGARSPGPDSTAPRPPPSPADVVRPRVLRPPVPHALGACADPHAAAASAGLLLVRGGAGKGQGLGRSPGVLEALRPAAPA